MHLPVNDLHHRVDPRLSHDRLADATGARRRPAGGVPLRRLAAPRARLECAQVLTLVVRRYCLAVALHCRFIRRSEFNNLNCILWTIFW